MAKLTLRLNLVAIALLGITLGGYSISVAGDRVPLSTFAEESRDDTVPLVFDPFYDAVDTAINAANLTQVANTPEDWQAIAKQWQAAIEMMKAVPATHEKYDIAQQRAFEIYPTNLAYAQTMAGTEALPALTADDTKLTQVDFGEGWPFILDGELHCEIEQVGNYSVSLVTLQSADNVFAVNGPAQARSVERGWFNMQEIWKDSPLGDGKAPMTWVVMRGEALCEDSL